jgi:ribosomal protein L34E
MKNTLGAAAPETENQPAEAHAGQVKSAQQKTGIGADHQAGTEQGKTVVATQKPDKKNQAAASQITGGKVSAWAEFDARSQSRSQMQRQEKSTAEPNRPTPTAARSTSNKRRIKTDFFIKEQKDSS